MELTKKIKDQIRTEALNNPTEEICGLILENGDVVSCPNRADDRDVHFIIASKDILRASRISKHAAVYHSHIKQKDVDDGLSDEDSILAEYFNLTFILYSLQKDEFFTYSPTGKPVGYVDRPYVRNVLDEFQLIIDYYKKELNITVERFYSRNCHNFLINNNFNEVNNLKKHDIIIMQKEIEHEKMVIYLGDDKILVHPDFAESRIVDYNYGLQSWTRRRYRHSKLL